MNPCQILKPVCEGRNYTYTFSYLIFAILHYFIVIFCVIEFE